MIENQEVAKTESNLPAEAPQNWGNEAVAPTDVLIPKVLLMQGISDLVADRKANAGDIVDSTSQEVLLSMDEIEKGKRLEVIPLKMFKNVVIEEYDSKKNKWKYLRTQDYRPNDEKNLWEFEEDGKKLRGNVTLNYYVLRADQTSQPDALPYVLSFRRTSRKAGQLIATYFMKCNMAKVPPASKTILIGSEGQTNKDGEPFKVFTAQEGKQTSKEQLAVAYNWFVMIQKGLTKVDETDVQSEEVGGASNDGPAF